jgi:hypothetical protein
MINATGDDDVSMEQQTGSNHCSTNNGDRGDNSWRLDSYLYNMLEQTGGISLPIYLVYAYLLARLSRPSFSNRRDILDAMEQEKEQSMVQHGDNDNDKDAVDHDDDNEDKDSASENKDTSTTNDETTDGGHRKRKKHNMPGFKALRWQLRREAAQAPPPVLCKRMSMLAAMRCDDGTGGVAFDVYRPHSNVCQAGTPPLFTCPYTLQQFG